MTSGTPERDNDPNDLGELDPEQFVGEPPAGDSQPGEFMSTDQSAATPAAPEDDESVPEEDA